MHVLRQSDAFIGHRVLPAPDENAWAEALAILGEVSHPMRSRMLRLTQQ
jgi:hypothetical protein